QSIAQKDMEIIRSKRGQGMGGAGGPAGQAKAKYRKRSRANPPGKCHSCNIRETPEWRRGPDGARTLCNACGLHYAKLMRKREKTLGPDGNAEAPAISVEMLRASTR
ncbi:GATA zinc finger-domain-containing protein, partial [Hysterangium stoloniferum]